MELSQLGSFTSGSQQCRVGAELLNIGVLFCAKYYYSPGIDEAEYGGAWELTKEGFLSGAAGFFVTWIIVYTGLHIDTL